jgi:Zn-dependent protease
LNCEYCGKEEALPFVCNYCGGTFCSEHRLPESHACTGDLSRRPVVKGATTSTFSWSDGSGYSTGRTPVPRSFSRVEVRDILIAWIALGCAFTIAITGGALGGFADRLGVYGGVPYFVPLSGPTSGPNAVLSCAYPGVTCIPIEFTVLLALATIGIGFILHELMHKFIAERYGFKAEFRMWPSGLAFAVLSSAIAGLVFAAPGATYIMGYNVNAKENGVISLAGPLTNIAIALLFLPLLLVNTGSAVLVEAGYLGSYFNFFLAAFNMLPIFVLDGAKVWRWNKAYWAGLFVPLVIVILFYWGVL